MKNYYDILEVHPEAGYEVIKASFKSLYSHNNPENFETYEDKIEAKKRRKQLKEAYSVLSDRRKKMKYDNYFDQTGGHVEIKKIPHETILVFISLSILIVVMAKYTMDNFFPKFVKLTAIIGNSPELKLFLILFLIVITVHKFIKNTQKRNIKYKKKIKTDKYCF